MNSNRLPHSSATTDVIAPINGKSHGASPQRHGRLTARGRKVVLVALVSPIVTLSMIMGGHVANASDSAPQTREVVVSTGESLWDIAVEVAPGQDPRRVIWTIQQLNHMDSSALTDGQTLIVPVATH